jgi:glutamyl-Q tRNA(Asp) synthetase
MYVGRFAPTPSGPLHLGSLVSALAARLAARARDGRFLVRIEDLDDARLERGAEAAILRALEAHGLGWDGAVLRQSARLEAYRAALERLRAAGALYDCACTRREVADSAVQGIEGPVYPGTCRDGIPPARRPTHDRRAQRVRTDRVPYAFEDGAQGALTQALERDIGDFVVARADGVIAYQLAVVVDDAEQGVTEVVRGADLLLSTPRQLHLQRLLGLPTPSYLHHPVATAADGAKLSKQHRAAPLDLAAPAANLCRALGLLGQRPPDALAGEPVATVLAWAEAHWDPARFRGQRSVAAEGADAAGRGAHI